MQAYGQFQSEFFQVMHRVMEFLHMEFELYGYHFSFSNVIWFLAISGMLGWAVREVMNRD